MKVKVKFISYEWDNYQGGSGSIFKREALIDIHEDSKVCDLKEICLDWITQKGFINSWGERKYYDTGIISIQIF